MKSIVQIISTTKTLLITNASRAIESGRDIAPTKRSVKATPRSRIFEICFSSLLVFTAIITNRFNRMVTGQAMVVMATVILKETVLFKSQMYSDDSGQKNTDLVWLEELVNDSIFFNVMIEAPR